MDIARRILQCFKVAVFGLFVSVLVALLFAGLFQSPSNDATRTGHYNPWFGEIGNATWDPLIESMATDDFDKLVNLIETRANPMEKGHAAHELLRFMPVVARPHDLMARPPTQDETENAAFDKSHSEVKKKDDNQRLKQLKAIHQLADAADGSGPERLSNYILLARQYQDVGAIEDAEKTFQQLADEIEKTGSVAQQLKTWFMPLLRDRVALLACGVMAFCIYLLKPSIDIWAKARAMKFHANSPDPFIQKAMGETPPVTPKIVLPQ